MYSAVCGWCGVHAHMPMIDRPGWFWIDWETAEKRVTATHRCNSCDGIVLSHGTFLEDELHSLPTVFTDPSPSEEHSWLHSEGRLSWLPPPKSRTEFPHVSKHVASAAREAYLCFEFEAYRAAISLARAVIEATAKDKNIAVDGIATKIKAMFDQGLIRQFVKDGADEVRHLGNDMAHGDFTAPVEREDADSVLTLMYEVLKEVYEGPGNVAASQARRAARQNQAGPAPNTGP